MKLALTDRDPYENYTVPRTNPHPKRVLELILISVKNSCVQAILRFYCPGSLDYRACFRLQVKLDVSKIIFPLIHLALNATV